MAKPKKTARPVRGQSYSSGGNGADVDDDEDVSLEADMCGTICATPSPMPHKILPVHILVKTGRAFRWPSYHAKKEKPCLALVVVAQSLVMADGSRQVVVS
mgnify:CR=1 FL=1